MERHDADGAKRRPDELVVEEPLEIRLDDHLVTTTMRTPGHDFELAAGFCFTDGLLAGAPVGRRALLRHRVGRRDRRSTSSPSTPAAWRPSRRPG